MVMIGIDEVGRGCWAGPLVAGAVILAKPIPGLKDSKRLTKKQRQDFDGTIRQQAAALSLGWVKPAEVDSLGLTAAVGLAMRRALAGINLAYDEIIIDGNINFFPENSKAKAIIKADNSVPAVSAASIIAKVARDNYMIKLAINYPEYGFEKHVGYGTALHLTKLQTWGVTSVHRRSYKPIQNLLSSE